MGREWYWSRSFRKGEKESPGCMSGVLHLFDFHQFQYTPQQQQQQNQAFKTDPLHIDQPFSKGVEAPRNSLELEGDLFPRNPLPPPIEEDDIPIGIRLVTSHPNSMEKDPSSDTTSSQGSRTPNLVARLMGLDLLPDHVCSPKIQSQPSPSRPKSNPSRRHLQTKDTNFTITDSTRYDTGSRSLPDTPRISSARRSDVDPRLSLQLNKENIDVNDFNYSPFSSRKIGKKEGKFQYEENKSPRKYAREIVKQVKESVSRRVGIDITNISTNNRCRNKDNEALTFNIRKTKRPTKSSDDTSPSKTSCSPRLRFLEPKTKPPTESKDQFKSFTKPRLSPSPLSSSISSSPLECTKNKSQTLPRSTVKCKKASCERFTQRPKKAAANIEKKCKAIRIHAPPSSQARAQAAVPLQLSCSSSPLYELQPQPLFDDRDDSRTTVTVGGAADFRYVSEILQCTGVHGATPVSFTRWFSPAHPVNPSLFLHLEHSFQPDTCGPLKHRSNRRLLFDLVDEILRDTLRPYLNMRPWARAAEKTEPPRHVTGEQLLHQLSSRVRGFPLANCQTLQDIDALVEKDLSGSNVRRWALYSAEEENESIVFEIEREIVDSLVHESLLLFLMEGAQ
ncbi:uncharacterized protein LOC131233514 [Magnolia sinica]|uniref:uncharacterized protein LOC131233514 n=1 Tax=Magnolia sinica TaxID=86752 RepID=UPI00265A3DD5|nr:uncharacterized protein LOC131233514 [Magnolia sinica]